MPGLCTRPPFVAALSFRCRLEGIRPVCRTDCGNGRGIYVDDRWVLGLAVPVPVGSGLSFRRRRGWKLWCWPVAGGGEPMVICGAVLRGRNSPDGDRESSRDDG